MSRVNAHHDELISGHENLNEKQPHRTQLAFMQASGVKQGDYGEGGGRGGGGGEGKGKGERGNGKFAAGLGCMSCLSLTLGQPAST